jgi:large subunit ribosomal protein L17
MMCALFQHESIRTTLPKAKDLRPIAEKVLTLGKDYQKAIHEAQRLHIHRQVLRKVGDEDVARKVVGTLAELIQDRPGGYIRILKAGFRYGDHAPMALIQLVDSTKYTP